MASGLGNCDRNRTVGMVVLYDRSECSGFFVEKYCWENEENLNIERFDSSMKS